MIVPLDFEPGSLAWCPLARALYVVDADSSRILAWQRSRDLVVIAVLSGRRSVRASLGQLALGRDGDLWAASSPGVVHQIPRSGAHRSLSVDPARSRRGLWVTGAGDVYTAYSLQEGAPHCAAIAQVNTTGLELDLVAGLSAPVGLVELEGALIVADRARGRLLRVPLSGAPTGPEARGAGPHPSTHATKTWPTIVRRPLGRTSFFTSFAAVDAPTALALGPAGTLLVGTALGEVVLLDRSGVVMRRVGGLGPVCGLAYDEAGRLFVAENGGVLRILEGVSTR